MMQQQQLRPPTTSRKWVLTYELILSIYTLAMAILSITLTIMEVQLKDGVPASATGNNLLALAVSTTVMCVLAIGSGIYVCYRINNWESAKVEPMAHVWDHWEIVMPLLACMVVQVCIAWWWNTVAGDANAAEIARRTFYTSSVVFGVFGGKTLLVAALIYKRCDSTCTERQYVEPDPVKLSRSRGWWLISLLTLHVAITAAFHAWMVIASYTDSRAGGFQGLFVGTTTVHGCALLALLGFYTWWTYTTPRGAATAHESTAFDRYIIYTTCYIFTVVAIMLGYLCRFGYDGTYDDPSLSVSQEKAEHALQWDRLGGYLLGMSPFLVRNLLCMIVTTRAYWPSVKLRRNNGVGNYSLLGELDDVAESNALTSQRSAVGHILRDTFHDGWGVAPVLSKKAT